MRPPHKQRAVAYTGLAKWWFGYSPTKLIYFGKRIASFGFFSADKMFSATLSMSFVPQKGSLTS